MEQIHGADARQSHERAPASNDRATALIMTEVMRRHDTSIVLVRVPEGRKQSSPVRMGSCGARAPMPEGPHAFSPGRASARRLCFAPKHYLNLFYFSHNKSHRVCTFVLRNHDKTPAPLCGGNVVMSPVLSLPCAGAVQPPAVARGGRCNPFSMRRTVSARVS